MIDEYIPQMLPPKMRMVWEQAFTRRLREADEEAAERTRGWLLESLGIPQRHIVESQASRKLWRDLASLRDIVHRAALNEDALFELIGMWGARAMARRYKSTVADQLSGESPATDYERYEDVMLRGVVNSLLKRGPLVLVELGSGVGRILLQYASCLATSRRAARQYRKAFPDMYAPSSVRHSDRLMMLLGVDFEARMLQSSSAWLRQTELYSEVERGLVCQVLGSVQYSPLGKNHDMFGGAAKLVCILFQTIGNQLKRAHRIRMVEQAWDLAQPHGVVLVSAFNGEAFDHVGVPYYKSIQASVGRGIYARNATFLSERGIYSKWMLPQELQDVCARGGMEDALILSDMSLAVFPGFERYIPAKVQAQSRQRSLVAVGATNTELLEIIRGALCV
ncbi:MAG: hypothetical protein AB1543_00715 [Candidatus Bipolaricaulota bacterium]